jgi:aminomethyltransferase
MLNESGGIIDDLVTYKIKDDEWLLVVNAARITADEAHLRKHLSADSKLENASARSGKLDLQGPLSEDVLAGIAGSRISSLKYYTFGFFDILGEENIISRTGYTGELGYEIYISRGKAVELWNALLKDARVKPAGLGARDTLRLEMGYGLYGQDMDESVTPFEAGLEKFLDLDKDFIGKDAILERKKKGALRQMVYFITDSRRAPRHNYKICRDGKEIGTVTSGSFSPSLKFGIGMGYVKEPLKKGDKILLCEGAVELNATTTDKPFYKNGTAQRRPLK